jgi:hypothetical protein
MPAADRRLVIVGEFQIPLGDFQEVYFDDWIGRARCDFNDARGLVAIMPRTRFYSDRARARMSH